MSHSQTLSPEIAARTLGAWWEMAGLEPFDLDGAIKAYQARALPSDMPVAATPPTGLLTGLPTSVRAKASVVRNPADIVGEAERLAKACTSIEALNKAVASFDGCGLKAGARHCVLPDGVVNAPVMIIAEAPDRDDDETGRALSGQNGELFDKMLASIGLSRSSNCYVMNLLPWRPPGDRKPTLEELAICQPFLVRHIELCNSKALLLLGSLPAQALLDTKDSIMKLRTRSFHYGAGQSLYTQCLLSPAYLRNRPAEKGLAWQDLLRFEAEISALGVAKTV